LKTQIEQIQKTITIPVKRWYGYVFVVAVLLMIAYYSGYRMGRTVERKGWLEIANPHPSVPSSET
jgi:hypothetical protein